MSGDNDDIKFCYNWEKIKNRANKYYYRRGGLV